MGAYYGIITIYENIRHYLCFVQFLFILIIDLKIYIIFFWIVLILNYPFIEMRFFNLIWRIKYKDQEEGKLNEMEEKLFSMIRPEIKEICI